MQKNSGKGFISANFEKKIKHSFFTEQLQTKASVSYKQWLHREFNTLSLTFWL